jgi:hypothetical protein
MLSHIEIDLDTSNTDQDMYELFVAGNRKISSLKSFENVRISFSPTLNIEYCTGQINNGKSLLFRQV